MTGVLPIGLEEATKTVQAVLAGGKEYVGVMKLHGDVSFDRVVKVFKEFTGEIYQRPPLRSSVKRRIRTRTIYYVSVLEMDGRNVLFKVGCQSGTYIRKLVHDVGEVLGVGSHMAELRRVRAGPYVEDEGLVRLQDLADAVAYLQERGDETWLRRVVLPVETSVALIPKVYIKDSAVEAICYGAHTAAPGISKVESGIVPGDLVAVMTLKNELVALARAEMSSQQMLEADHGIALKTERVIMPKGRYPKTL